jgi:predicted ribonuclease YlaK
MIDGRAVFDTNALLINPNYINEVKEPIVPYVVLQELDRLKMETNTERGWQARHAVRILKSASHVEFVDVYDIHSNWYSTFPFKGNDDLIIDCAVSRHASYIVTGDLIMQLKASAKKLKVIDIFDTLTEEDDYKGYVEKTLTDEELANFYENWGNNMFNLLTNQYLIIRNTNGDIIQVLKWKGEEYKEVDVRRIRKGFKTVQFGDFKPKDVYQALVLDSLDNNQVTMVKGKAGSGKSLLSLNYAIHQIEQRKYDRLICFVNPMASRNSAKLGYYPGDRNEKLLDSSVGAMLGAKFGDKLAVELMITQNKLLLLPFSDIRGFDTTGMNAIVYIIEAQNLDVDLMKLAIQRVGEDSKLIIDGDYNQQVDSPMYEGANNGMRRASQVLRGHDFYGEVELPNIYRSRLAAVADLM